jgi:hypothetical protein
MKSSSDKSLHRIALEFRRDVLGKRQSNEMCFAICAPLATLLTLYGYDVTLIEGWVSVYTINHFWLRLNDGRILDPTADQFRKPNGAKMPKVYLGERSEWYREN